MPSGDVGGPVRGEEGSASLELVGALPFLLVAILVAAQLALAGASLWSAALAARAGARADLVGGSAARAARRALPSPLRDGARVAGSDVVSVEVPVPRILPGLPAPTVGARTVLGPGRG